MNSSYIGWICERVGGTCGRSFLCNELAKIEFYAINERDAARGTDALYLRERYLETNDVCEETKKELLESPPTVLEVLIFLAEKIENDILYIPGTDRVSKWFWSFIENMNLDVVTDKNWSWEAERYVRSRVQIWLNREYGPHGENGNIFYCDLILKDEEDFDLREMPIWDQAWKFESNSLLTLPF